MTKFIRLTEANEAGRTLLVNVKQIAYVQTSNRPNGDMYIKLMIKSADTNKSDGQYFFVKEKLDDIERMLVDDK